jgi:hypothetical protein
MWTRYRKLKHWVTPLLLAICLWLMRGEPDESPRWTVAMVLTVIMVTLYLAEEFVWMKVAKGRPCQDCGKMVPVKTLHITLKCPHCGKVFA